MKTFFTPNARKHRLKLCLMAFLFVLTIPAFAQLGIYSFTGLSGCSNTSVTTQPANAVFSNFTVNGPACRGTINAFDAKGWSNNGGITLSEFLQFSVTPSAGFALSLTGLSFTESVDRVPNTGTTNWVLRSSLDNFATDISTGTATIAAQSPVVTLPANFSGTGSVTFRIYTSNIKDGGTTFTIDEVALTGNVIGLPATPGNPTSNSPQCFNTGVTLNFNGTPPAGETWYWEPSATSTITANSSSSYTVYTAGTYYVRSQDNTTLAWSAAGSATVAFTPQVSAPVFALGASSSRCRGAGSVTYTATATNSTGITYSLDAASIAEGDIIDPASGAVTYVSTWAGPSTITATAAGCGNPVSTDHIVSASPDVAVPVFAQGDSSVRCQKGGPAGEVTYTATAANNTGITYALDAGGLAGGNTINAATGKVTYAAAWTGYCTITATAQGCSGPKTATHVESTTPTVSAPVFTNGTTSTRCQGAGTVVYTATAANSTGITYTLNNTALTAGNTIDAATGTVTYTAGWTGATTITASAAGCNGPLTSVHTVTITPVVGTPTFSLGTTSSRCRGAGSGTYTATASNSTAISYSLDAASLTQGNTINASTGAVTYVSAWTGPTIVTATATGCNGTSSANHTISMLPDVAAPVFALGSTSTRCQLGGGSGAVTYTATATNSTGITYSIDALSQLGGCSINSSTGKVTYGALWIGNTTITATAAGCGGPVSSTHTVLTNAAVGTPVFTNGSTSTRCQGAGTVSYTATASNSSGIIYSLNNAALTAGNTINSSTGDVTYTSGWTGSTVITASAAGCFGPTTAQHTVTITPTVGTPNFTGGAAVRCQLGSTVTYTATATNTTGITYSLDAASLAGGNTINAANGQVTYSASWSGNSTITASAAGCNGPATASFLVTITPTVGFPSFLGGPTSTRCQGTGSVTYTAFASNATGMTYTLDAASISGGNSISSSTGLVVYSASWSGISTITASASGCNGPKTATLTVAITPTVGMPVFSPGANSTRCQGANTVTYAATATNTTGITYSLNAAAISGGNTIDAVTGQVTYVAGWTGTTTITASAAGCNGPKTAVHTVTITSTVGSPVFTLGRFSSRQQGAATITYDAAATNATGINYSLDAASLAAGNTINTTTGAVTYVATWSGTTIITATASGCNGPSAGVPHTVYINANIVGIPLYPSDPSQALDRVDPVATNDNTTATSSLLNSAGTGIAIDATSSSSSANPGSTSFSLSHTTGSGTNRFMLVSVSQKNMLVTGVTYAGQALTKVGEEITNGNARIHLYKLVNPPSGTANVVVSLSANPDKGIVVGVTTFSGVDQATPLGTFNSAQGTGTASSVTVASGTGELVYDVNACRLATITPNAGQTQKYNVNSTNEIYGGGSTATGAASVTMGWTASASQDWAIGAVSVHPALTPVTTFTQSPALCSPLIIKAGQNITVTNYVNITSGTMPASPAITAQLLYGSTGIITLSSPAYNSTTGILTWTGQVASDVTIPAGQAITYKITTAQAGVSFNILFDSKTKPSKINLPVSTYIDITSIDVYDAPYPGGNIIYSALNNRTVYVRAVVTAPFGASDINGTNISIAPSGTTAAAAVVATGSCSKTYEYAWTTPIAAGNYDITGTAFQGFENSVTRVVNFNINLCSTCPPVAEVDSARGAGGAPIIVDVLANDYDPNNNINRASLSILTQPNNGAGYLSGGKIIYLPNGSYAGKDTLTYQICDSTSPAPLCAIGQVIITTDPLIFDPCSDATDSHTYYLPFPEDQSRMALDSSGSITMPSNNIRTIISIKVPYPGMKIVWDEWEDGYEANPLNPTQTTTKVWGDGNPYNGIAPGYPDDILPAGASIVLDNTIPTNPRVPANIFYDGRDRIFASGQIAVTQVSGEPSIISVQVMKTNVTATSDYGTSFTIPVGQNFNSRDFYYTALFMRAADDSTIIKVDKDNDGTFETNDTLNRGEVAFVNGGVMAGATVISNKPIGIDVHFGGNDSYSSREVPIYPASWYSNTYYTPVPTTGRAANPADTAVVMLYNSLSRPITINWSSGIPSSGSVTIPAKTTIRFPMAMSQTAAYKFVNPTGEAFTAIEIVDSYTPGGGANVGSDFDWSFNLIAENRLTDFATIAWAPGSTDGTRNDNPIWVTPSMNTTIYVKYNGDVLNGGSVSPCGLHYDVSYALNVLNYKRILDPNDKDQSGIAIFTCNGAKMAAVYGEDPSTALTGNPSWDVGSTIQPFCKQKLLFANDDYARTMINQPVTIPVLLNDFGFLAVVDPSTVNTTGLLQPKNGTTTINANGTIIYTPNPGFTGKDTFEYNVCSTPSPIVCDIATVYVDIAVCPAPLNQNIITGSVFMDTNKDGINNDGGTGYTPATVYLYIDGNCDGIATANELKDSVVVDSTGSYQFVTYPERITSDNFDTPAGTNSCAAGSDGNAPWKSNWVDQGDASTGYCNSSQTAANTDVEILKDPGFSYALRLKDRSMSATRTIDLTGASYAFLSFSYRRKSTTMTSGHNLIVQASRDGTTFGTVYTIAGDGNTDAAYVNVYTQDISQYAAATTYIRFLTNGSMAESDSVYIDNVSVKYVKYPECYITAINSFLIPSTYHLTTGGTHVMTATNGITCLTPNDFGVAKNSISISGTMYNDANGITDNLVNGTANGYPGSDYMYAYLIDSTGKIAFKTTVDPANGTYLFPLANVQTTYSIMLSSDNLVQGSTAPSGAALPQGWVNTGEAYGANNLAGTGLKATIANGTITVKTGLVNVTNVNFGCERLPNSDNKSASYLHNVFNTLYAVPGFTGSDPEDGILGSGKTYKITSLPTGAVLYYGGVSVVLNQVINNFNPALLKIDPDDNTVVTTFTYAAQDAAGQFDPTPATVQIDWGAFVLPVTLLDFSGRLNDNTVYLSWKTSTESNSDHFEIERSAEARSFMHIGNVAARGFSSTTSNYSAVDLIPLNGMNYYRLKMMSRDQTFVYSNVIHFLVAGDAFDAPIVHPNPFVNLVDVYMTLKSAGTVDLTFIDNSGRSVYRTRMTGVKGDNTFNIRELDRLPAGSYILNITTPDEHYSQKLIKQ